MDSLLSVCDILRSVFWAFQTGSDTLWRGCGAGTKNVDSAEFPTLTRREEKCCLTSMRRQHKSPASLTLILLAAHSPVFAGAGIEAFKAGEPAKADLVNHNFRYLDSVKVEQEDFKLLRSAVTAKADKAIIDSLLATKANFSSLDSFVKNGANYPIRIEIPDEKSKAIYAADGINYSLDRSRASYSMNGLSYSDFYKGSLVLGMGLLSYSKTERGIGGNILNFQERGKFSFSFNSIDAGTTEQVLSVNSSDAEMGQGIEVSGNIKISGTLIAPTKSFPDFVFSPTYKLQPLSETKAFITQNGHLPNIPSAKEVEKSGMDLVQMNQILLQKVEELTLHAIAQQEQIEALKARIPAP